jgi:serine/threonine protein kinase
MTFWFEDGTELGQCVRILDVPGTLSGDILRLCRQLPSVSGHCEIDGDNIRPLDHCLKHPKLEEGDSEDVSELVAELPVVAVDQSKHFVKKGKYRSEVQNFIKCQGGSVPGRPLSSNVIQLLGRSSNGELVFEKLRSNRETFYRSHTLDVYKSWILQLINGLECLHNVGIVHRDLRSDNIVFSEDGKRLLICDLESRWGMRLAPEVALRGGIEDSGWSPMSDIYDIGGCIKSMVYANHPLTNFVEWPVPHPLQAIVDACMRPAAGERPSLAELREMVDKIPA